MIDELVCGWKADPRLDPDRAFLASRVRPCSEQPTQVAEGGADGWEPPIDYGCQLRSVITVHDFGEVIVAMHDAGLEGVRPIGFEPCADALDVAETSGPGPAFKARVAFQLRSPARYLPLEKARGLPKVRQAQRLVVQGAKFCHRLDQRHPHAMLNFGGARM